jgi:hypothetical protein
LPVPRSGPDAISVMIFGVGGTFRPGFLTPAQAEELNRMRAALAALDRMGTVPPLTITRLANGQPVIGMGAGGGGAGSSFWARITAEGGGPVAYSWEKYELAPSGLFQAVTPAVTGELNAYLVPHAVGGYVPAADVGAVVRMWPSTTRASSYEFRLEVTKARGKLDGALSFSSSATVSVWRVNSSGTDVDTGVNVTAHSWLMSSGDSIDAGTEVTIFYDHGSGRWYVDGADC